jgi:hypothetical protein
MKGEKMGLGSYLLYDSLRKRERRLERLRARKRQHAWDGWTPEDKIRFTRICHEISNGNQDGRRELAGLVREVHRRRKSLRS